MTDFSKVRIPATRFGRGGSYATGTRIRRHQTKGFYDEVPNTSGGSVVVNEVTDWPDGNKAWYNVWKKDLTGNVTSSLVGPDFVGQILILNLSTANGFSWTLNTTVVSDGGTDYTQIVLNGDGENVFLLGVDRAGTLRWYVVKQHGATLT